ncbi:hypothetical protein BDN67DRAFT_986068 [Paxillus ammoniavirescens]|nr:hypothetical protein BDN67DRAFT_986068 [Paxillus ammoniavirescens]
MRQLVVNLMHCILEGLVQHHVQSLLGLTNETSDATPSSNPAFHFPFEQVDPNVAEELSMSRKEISQVSALHMLLTAQVPHHADNVAVKTYLDQLRESIFRKNIHALKFVCQSLGCIPLKKGKTFKADYTKALIDVIHDMITPSWLGSVPSNFGDSAAGTIKADEWRTLAMVHLPIALIGLWGNWGETQASPRNNNKSDLKVVLDHTMDLVSTVYLACACTTSDNRATAY